MIESASMPSIVIRGRRFFNQVPIAPIALPCTRPSVRSVPWPGTPLYMHPASDSIASSPFSLHFCRRATLADVTKTTNMTPDMTILEVAMSPELN